MDSDRKSTVSSFYGGPKSSLDALNTDFPAPLTHAERTRKDSSSSFFNPDRASRANVDLINGVQSNSAGYNRNSFFHTGREEPLKGGRDEEQVDDSWDVYADFNNTGPRYSAAFGQGDKGYQQIVRPPGDDAGSTIGPVELVTVPALGPEWKRSEMRDMTKAGKREKKSESRAQKWKEWRRGERGLCGRWFTRKFLVFFLFGFAVVAGIVLAFTIPRVPGFSFNDQTPLTAATGSFANSIPATFSRAPANFSFPAIASLQVDTSSNYLPLTFNHLRGTVFDLDSNRQVATGDLAHKTIPAKAFPVIQLPLNFTYVATNSSDPTWLNWYNGCKNKATYADGVRPAVKFRLVLDMVIAGLPSHHFASTQVTDADCPIELPQNSA
jgi:hypothetical protein